MAKKRSESSTYQSRYSPGEWVTPAQYIIEYVCENAAQYTGRDLPVRFWKNDEWQKFYVSQTRAAHKLLKEYKARSIISAIKKNKIRSLIPKWIAGAVKREEDALDKKLIEKASGKKYKPKQQPKRIIKKQENKKTLKSGSFNKLLALDEEIENG